ncbi:oxidoreductase [Curtobacterium sp. Leaf261]|uniref:oxidoreductase n=1 Tax=Curtobacterium sp. Leaf261 TaxID=1736311 RepID=UPI000701A4D4|nr:oxidoreductase [Curtobacterium sp. Leaf261]KQO64448.1 oxidoreductase [Curtobacterium sp. Leaf261]
MTTLPGGTLTLADDLTLTRFGYGAMQLAGKGVMGPPEDVQGAQETLRAVIELGITHIDTSDYYGPFVTNELIRDTLHPYPDDLHIVTKVGARRTERGQWPSALGRDDIRQAIDENLEHLGLPAMDVVNLRVGGQAAPVEGSIAEPLEALTELQEEGLVRHIGVSNVTMTQFEEARSYAEVVCVQNNYNLAHRDHDDLVDACAEAGMGFTPFFPLGGFSPLQSTTLEQVATRIGATPLQTALAWLMQRSPTMLLIPGTKSVAHLHENVAGAAIELPEDALRELNAIGNAA